MLVFSTTMYRRHLRNREWRGHVNVTWRPDSKLLGILFQCNRELRLWLKSGRANEYPCPGDHRLIRPFLGSGVEARKVFTSMDGSKIFNYDCIPAKYEYEVMAPSVLFIVLGLVAVTQFRWYINGCSYYCRYGWSFKNSMAKK